MDPDIVKKKSHVIRYVPNFMARMAKPALLRTMVRTENRAVGAGLLQLQLEDRLLCGRTVGDDGGSRNDTPDETHHTSGARVEPCPKACP